MSPIPSDARNRNRRRPACASLAALCALAAALPAAAGAAVSYEPPDGRILSGAAVEYPVATKGPEFTAATGQEGLAIIHGYVGHLQSLEDILRQFRSVDSAVMLSWRAIAKDSGAAGGDLTGVANGEIDGYLVTSAEAVASYPRPVFIRLYWEFTGDWFEWSTYTGSGAQRAGNSPAAFRDAWKRIRIVFDGGTHAEVNARLAEAGLPPLTAGGSTLPNAAAAWVWSVAKGGVKPADKPHRTADYYPGDAYVDWVGQGIHQYRSDPFSYWAARVGGPDPLATVDAVYDFAVSRGKPFMFSEWAIATAPYGNGDDPQYVDDALTWLESHPEAKAQVWFDRDMGGYTHQIHNFPRARAVFTAHVTGGRYIQDWRRAGPVVRGPSPGAAGAAPDPSATTPRSRGARATMCGGRRATIVGTPGADRLTGTRGRDVIVGLGGRDRIAGRGGPDVVCGGPGRDTIRGGAGRDVIRGGAGADRLFGGRGRDRLLGGAGRDRLDGQLGVRDMLFGGRGRDLCIRGLRRSC